MFFKRFVAFFVSFPIPPKIGNQNNTHFVSCNSTRNGRWIFGFGKESLVSLTRTMPAIKISHVVSFSSEDAVHRAENLLTPK